MNGINIDQVHTAKPAHLPLDNAHAAVLTVIARVGLVDRSTVSAVVSDSGPLIVALEAAGCIAGRKIDRRDGSKTTMYRMQPKGTAALSEHANRSAMHASSMPQQPTVAGGRNPFSSEIYMGLELRRLCTRPGAYDAMAIPSLINGRERTLLKSELPTVSATAA